MKTDKKTISRKARQRRVRAKISGTAVRPRVSIYRSNTALTAQLIDDVAGKTIGAVSTAKSNGKTLGERVISAGGDMAKVCADNKIKEVVFDRGGYAYIGNVKAFADALRDGGIKF
jgi:large subunit ribosomal protein L18